MRKWLFLMLAGYFWKKYQAKGAVMPAPARAGRALDGGTS
jgi:hypothetical protein